MKEQRRYIKTIVNGEPRYIVEARKNCFHKWKRQWFSFMDGRSDATELTIEELGCVCNWYCPESKEVDNDIKAYLNEQERIRYENPYHITKYRSENSRIIDTLCMAKDIEDLSDGYHTFKQLYDFRREYNAALVNSGVWPAHKSHRHNDGELCFGGGWFIVMMETPFGQISNHYEDEYWDEFHCEEKEVADKWDGHTDEDVLERLKKCNEKVR